MDTVLPNELWQWPLLAAVVTVVGWLLYQMREQMKQSDKERAENTEFIHQLVQKSDLERAGFIESLKQLITASLQAQQAMVYSIEKHAADADKNFAILCKDIDQRHKDLVGKLDKISGGK